MKELTLALACRLAMNLDPTHRAEILRDHPSLTAWAKHIMSVGVAWALIVRGKPVCAVGVFSVEEGGDTGHLWLAGARGWTRHVRKLAPFWKGLLTSGAYANYVCDTFVGNDAEERWVTHLGFRKFGHTDGKNLYAMGASHGLIG